MANVAGQQSSTSSLSAQAEDDFNRFGRQLAWRARDSAPMLEMTRRLKDRLYMEIGEVTGGFLIGSQEDGTSIAGRSDVDYGLRFQLRHGDSSVLLRRLRRALVAIYPAARAVRVDQPGVSVQVGPSPWHRIELIPVVSSRRRSRRTTSVLAEGIWHGVLPDGAGGWRPTSPEAYADLVTVTDYDRAVPGNAVVVRTVDDRGRVLSESRGRDTGTVRASVRVLKAWKYVHNLPILSLYLLLKTVDVAGLSPVSLSSRETFRRVIRTLVEGDLAAVPDPVNAGNLIEACKAAHKGRVRAAAVAAARDADLAARAEESGSFDE